MNNAIGRAKKQKQKQKTYNFCQKLAKYQRSLSHHHTDAFYLSDLFARVFQNSCLDEWLAKSIFVSSYKIKVVPKKLYLNQLYMNS